MGKPYKYLLRPGYGSDKLLLEFNISNSDTEFVKDLWTTIKEIKPKVGAIDDLWMNDEIVYHISSNKGAFELSKDNWDNVFIMAENNQSCILEIDQILNKNDLFEKRDVDYEQYKNIKSYTGR